MRENNPLSGTLTRENVAANVRAALKRAGVSERSMADRIGLPQSNFSRRMNSEVPFSAEQIAAIAAELGTSPAALFETPAVAA